MMTNQKSICLVFLICLGAAAKADVINVSVPSAVSDAIDIYRVDCAEEGSELKLDGDEIFKLWTDEGEAAYVVHAMFTCGDLGHLWCGTMGCPTQIVLNDVVYETDRILQRPPDRISQKPDGTITYWTPDGFEFNAEP